MHAATWPWAGSTQSPAHRAGHILHPAWQVCFDVLLPPIIFYAGFTVKRKLFFRNFTTLVLFGVVGTFITSGLIAAGGC